MELEKIELKAQLRNFEIELQRLNMRETIWVEVITHFRARLEQVDTKRRKVKQAIQDVRMQLRAIEAAQASTDNK